jgi:hypothetical protein
MHRIGHRLIDAILILAYLIVITLLLLIKLQLLRLRSCGSSLCICPFTEGSEQMTTGAQTSQSRHFFPAEADFRTPRPGAAAHSINAPKHMEQPQHALQSRHRQRLTSGKADLSSLSSGGQR